MEKSNTTLDDQNYHQSWAGRYLVPTGAKLEKETHSFF